MNKNVRTALLYLFLIALAAVLVSRFTGGAPVATPVDTATLQQALTDGRVLELTAEARRGQVSGVWYAKDEDRKKGEAGQENFTSTYAGDDAFYQLLNDTKAKYPSTFKYDIDVSDSIPWGSILFNVALLGVLLFFLFFFMQQMQGGNSKIMSFGKARARRMTRDQPRITFKDVAGCDEAIEELEEIKEFLANPGKFQALGAKIPKGVLLVGPPGTGKTLLARAVAGEAAVPFFSISGSDFVEMFVGVGASRVRDLFEQAKAAAPCIIFMDEIDAVGRHRGAGVGGGHDEREQTLNQLLVEMDGFDLKDNVILIAATNRPDILDPALLRPGRFDRQVVVDRPDIKGRIGILKIHTRGKPMAEEVDLEVLARRTPGFTGADLANMVNEAALLAARHGKKRIDMTELEEGIDRVVAGPERKSRIMSEEERLNTAYHEAGHAIVGHVLPKTDPIHKVTIIPRGRALGLTMSLPTEDKYSVTKGEMLDQIAMMLGGRVAEEIVFSDVTTGASQDIERATRLAKAMVTRYGMSEKLGPQTFGDANHEVFLGRDFAANPDYSQEIAYEIDKEISRLIEEAHDKAHGLLTERRAQLDMMAKVLVERETVEGGALEALLEDKWQEFLDAEAAEAAGRAAESGSKPKRTRKKAEEPPAPSAPEGAVQP